MKISAIIALIACIGYFVPVYSLKDTLWVPVIYYDFRADKSNPNFNMDLNINSVVSGMVKDNLSSDYKPLF